MYIYVHLYLDTCPSIESGKCTNRRSTSVSKFARFLFNFHECVWDHVRAHLPRNSNLKFLRRVDWIYPYFPPGIGYRLSYSELGCNIFLFKKWEISGNIFKKSIYIYICIRRRRFARFNFINDTCPDKFLI